MAINQVLELRKQNNYHGTTSIRLEDSERDCIYTAGRKQLNGSCGFQQKDYEILSKDSYSEVGDIKKLVDWDSLKLEIDKQEDKIRQDWEKFQLIFDFLEEDGIRTENFSKKYLLKEIKLIKR